MINKVLKEYNRKIEDAAEVFLPDKDSRYKILTDSMRYSLLLGGKRIRPALLLEFYKANGGEGDNAVPFALALEMIHTYSLIHDDLPCMDNDDMRRGKPSNHKVYGEDTALLAGDGLLTLAFGVAASTKGIPAERVVAAIKALSDLAGVNGMVGGQVIDLQSEGKSVSADVIEELNLLKTGGLLRAAAKIGAILAGADQSLVEKADQYGKSLGMAFQIVDDILDVTSSAEVLGKPTGSDQKNGKSTFVSLYGIEECRQRVDSLTNEALSCLDCFSGDTLFLKELTLYLAKREH